MKFAKHFLLFGLLALPLFNAVNAQSTDRFIRIVGNAKEEFKADRISVYLTVSEVQPNEYRQIRYRPVEQIYEELVEELGKIGIAESQLEPDELTKFNKYQKVKMDQYKIVLSNHDAIAKIADFQMEGFAIKEVKYIFKDPGIEAEEALTVAALNDAKRKAENLAKELGKKLGKILNVEDTSSGCCREIPESNRPDVVKTYRVNVTFELID